MKEGGKMLMIVGGVIFVAGVVLWIGSDKLKWFSNLPGDIRVKRPGFSFFSPITSMILVSICISLILWLIRKILP